MLQLLSHGVLVTEEEGTGRVELLRCMSGHVPRDATGLRCSITECGNVVVIFTSEEMPEVGPGGLIPVQQPPMFNIESRKRRDGDPDAMDRPWL